MASFDPDAAAQAARLWAPGNGLSLTDRAWAQTNVGLTVRVARPPATD